MHFDIRLASWFHESRDDGTAASLERRWTHYANARTVKMIFILFYFVPFI